MPDAATRHFSGVAPRVLNSGLAPSLREPPRSAKFATASPIAQRLTARTRHLCRAWVKGTDPQLLVGHGRWRPRVGRRAPLLAQVALLRDRVGFLESARPSGAGFGAVRLYNKGLLLTGSA